MLGSTFLFPDITAGFGGFTAPVIPDGVSNVVTLQLRNQDNFGSVYGLRGVLHDHLVTIRNIRESPKPGLPTITRHSAEYALTLRDTISAGIATPAVPYVCGVYMRLPSTGVPLLLAGALAEISAAINQTAGAKSLKMMNFES